MLPARHRLRLLLPPAWPRTEDPPAPGRTRYSRMSEQAQTAAWVAKLLSASRFHYKRVPLDDALSSQIFDRYLEVARRRQAPSSPRPTSPLRRLRTSLDDAMRDQKLQPAVRPVQRYVQRVANAPRLRAQGAQKRVRFHRRRELPSTTARTRRGRPSADELDELWRKRVKNDWLRLKLAGKDDKAIRETLDKRYVNFDAKRVREERRRVPDLHERLRESIEPHTSYMNPRASENFNISMRLSLEGIGAVLQERDEYVTIRRTRAGRSGRALRKAQGRRPHRRRGAGRQGAMTDVLGWRVDDVVDADPRHQGHHGACSTSCRPTPGRWQAQVVTLVRDKVKLEEQAAPKSVIELGPATARGASA
jgi:carboxyl-terminal processing protease